jgi:hypothetical protein
MAIKEFFELSANENILTPTPSQIAIQTDPDISLLKTAYKFRTKILAVLGAYGMHRDVFIYINPLAEAHPKRPIVEVACEVFDLEPADFLDAEIWDATWEKGDKF